MRVDFLFNAPDRLLAACRVAAKRYRLNEPLLVYCRDASRLAEFDQRLWDFEELAFVPHVRAGDPLEAATPVVLWDGTATVQGRAWLLNLDDEPLPLLKGCERLVEVVSQDEQDRQRARQRWRHYQAAGLEITQHNLGQTAT